MTEPNSTGTVQQPTGAIKKSSILFVFFGSAGLMFYGALAACLGSSSSSPNPDGGTVPGTTPVCGACAKDTECMTGSICGVTSGVCEKGCSSSAECPAPSICDTHGNCSCTPDSGPGPDADVDGSSTTTIVPPSSAGVVSTIVYPNPGGGYGWNVGGRFAALTAGGYTLTKTKYGACTFTSFAGAPGVTTNLNAGVLTSTHGTTTDTANPDSMNNYYTGGSGVTPHFSPGDLVTLSWAGDVADGGVGPGSASINAPGTVTLVRPAAPDSGPVVVQTTQPFAIAFTGTSVYGTLHIGIYGGDAASSVDCYYDAAAPGTFSISPAAMNGLGLGNGSFFAELSSAKYVTGGVMPVTVEVRGTVLGPNGQTFGTQLATITH